MVVLWFNIPKRKEKQTKQVKEETKTKRKEKDPKKIKMIVTECAVN
jgi:hypothetical protein